MNNTYQIAVFTKNGLSGIENGDFRGTAILHNISNDFPEISEIQVADLYSIVGGVSAAELERLARALTNPVVQNFFVLPQAQNLQLSAGDLMVEIGFLPGVTDNTANTVAEMMQDLFAASFLETESGYPLPNPPPHGEGILSSRDVAVYSSKLYILQGDVNQLTAEKFASRFSNPLINRVHYWSVDEFRNRKSFVIPKVKLGGKPTAYEVVLNVSDDELLEIANRGIRGEDGIRRGPLGLSLDYMKAIRDYFAKEGRNPTDIEVETIAQTWSEHCKHTIFASPIDDVRDGIFKHYIRRATEEIRKLRGSNDICVSVFKDNAGAIIFDDDWLICDKVETHNSPSALDPFGGAITGIVGVNRDALGFGLGARPIINRYGFCFAYPDYQPDLFRDSAATQPVLSPQTIADGIIAGVEAGGNCSGIPTPCGFVYYDNRYAGKPLVFVGTIGLIPRMLAGNPSHVKSARAGDLIMMVGGRIGRDGIHGATFSSVALDEGSPSTAVQIGDPITQKKMSDAIIRDVRELGLYSAITDNGAGGLSSSIGEMGRDSGGFEVQLDKAPLKYPGMAPWEIWISESQERMTLSVPPENAQKLIEIFRKRGVEATVIGTFTNSGKAVVKWQENTLMNMSMDFLHDGLPEKHLFTSESGAVTPPTSPSSSLSARKVDLLEALPELLASPNIASKEEIATLYDHEVQAGSALKPLQGVGRVFAEATATRPVLQSHKAVVTTYGLAPLYGDIDCYAMAAASIDMAVRAAVAAGASLKKTAILDNYCWCDSTNPYRLWQLKEAARACFDVAVAYGTPYVSGKDSMFNDFKGFNSRGEAVMLSAPPTLLVSAIGIADDVHKLVSLDAKFAGDFIYLIGDTADEMGGSQYNHLLGIDGGNVPVLDAQRALKIYEKYQQAIDVELIASAIPVNFGGLGVAIAKKCIAGGLGATVHALPLPLQQAGGEDNPSHRLRGEDGWGATTLFSESLGRILVSINPNKASALEGIMGDSAHKIGALNDSGKLTINEYSWNINDLERSYKRGS
jgi:phosphoribosylformylglycinamidine synthase